MQTIEFFRTNGNVLKALSGTDHISGLVAYVSTLPSGFSATDPIHACSSLDTAATLGITADAEAWDVRVLYYHLKECFRINPSISLYVGCWTRPTGGNTYTEINALQSYAAGAIKQVGVWNGSVALAKADITALQGIADGLKARNKSLVVLYSPKVPESMVTLAQPLSGSNCCDVSVVIAQDGAGLGAELYGDADNTDKVTVGCIGSLLGTLSKAAVNQSIAAVKEFPAGIALPALGNGKLMRELDDATIEQLDANRYLFLRTYDGISDCFWNDSHTMDAPTSDYAYIEAERTMNKACRNIYTYIIPELGSTVFVDKDTGKLQSYSVAHIETTANKALEDMEKAGELSGYKAEIDADQNVLSASQIEVVIRAVQTGVVRKFLIKVGFSESV